MNGWHTPALMLIALLVGGLLPVQGAFNTRLSQLVNDPFLAAFVSFVVGAVLLGLIYLLLRGDWPPLAQWRQVPWYLFAGGAIGAAFVTLVVVLAPRIGIANVLAAAIAGQLVVSLILDHFGLFGIARQPISLQRLLGVVLLLAGLWMLQRR